MIHPISELHFGAYFTCNLLVNDGLNVSETTYALNFNDIYTFSQFSKKEMGTSPKNIFKST